MHVDKPGDGSLLGHTLSMLGSRQMVVFYCWISIGTVFGVVHQGWTVVTGM